MPCQLPPHGAASAPIETFGMARRELAEEIKRDRRHDTFTDLMVDTTGHPCLLVWACRAPDESADDAARYLSGYLSAKKYQVSAQMPQRPRRPPRRA